MDVHESDYDTCSEGLGGLQEAAPNEGDASADDNEMGPRQEKDVSLADLYITEVADENRYMQYRCSTVQVKPSTLYEELNLFKKAKYIVTCVLKFTSFCFTVWLTLAATTFAANLQKSSPNTWNKLFPKKEGKMGNIIYHLRLVNYTGFLQVYHAWLGGDDDEKFKEQAKRRNARITHINRITYALDSLYGIDLINNILAVTYYNTSMSRNSLVILSCQIFLQYMSVPSFFFNYPDTIIEPDGFSQVVKARLIDLYSNWLIICVGTIVIVGCCVALAIACVFGWLYCILALLTCGYILPHREAQ